MQPSSESAPRQSSGGSTASRPRGNRGADACAATKAGAEKDDSSGG